MNVAISIDYKKHILTGLLAPAFILISCFLVYLSFIAPYFYQLFFGEYNSKSSSSLLFLVAFTWLVFCIIPYILSIYICQLKPADIGLALPKKLKNTVILTGIAIALLVPFSYFFAGKIPFKLYYSLTEFSLFKFILLHITILPLYYLAEEFFFRGFFFLTLWRMWGWHSFWITDIIFTLAHLTKPIPELLLAIPASVVLNYLTLKTNSIYPAYVVHMLLGVLLNVMVYVNLY